MTAPTSSARFRARALGWSLPAPGLSLKEPGLSVDPRTMRLARRERVRCGRSREAAVAAGYRRLALLLRAPGAGARA